MRRRISVKGEGCSELLADHSNNFSCDWSLNYRLVIRYAWLIARLLPVFFWNVCWPLSSVSVLLHIWTSSSETFSRPSTMANMHKRLPRKLSHNWVKGSTLTEFEAFLCERTQPVLVDGDKWAVASVLSGSPQGTVLGLLILMTFISDLPSQFCSRTLFFFFYS